MKVTDLVNPNIDLDTLRERLRKIRSTRIITPKVEKRRVKAAQNKTTRTITSLEKLIKGLTPEQIEELIKQAES